MMRPIVNEDCQLCYGRHAYLRVTVFIKYLFVSDNKNI